MLQDPAELQLHCLCKNLALSKQLLKNSLCGKKTSHGHLPFKERPINLMHRLWLSMPVSVLQPSPALLQALGNYQPYQTIRVRLLAGTMEGSPPSGLTGSSPFALPSGSGWGIDKVCLALISWDFTAFNVICI